MATLGQDATVMGRARSKKLKNAVIDNHPVLNALKENGGIRYESGGRDVVEEVMTGQHTSAAWGAEMGAVNLTDPTVADAAYFDWKFLFGAATWSVAETLKNRDLVVTLV